MTLHTIDPIELLAHMEDITSDPQKLRQAKEQIATFHELMKMSVKELFDRAREPAITIAFAADFGTWLEVERDGKLVVPTAHPVFIFLRENEIVLAKYYKRLGTQHLFSTWDGTTHSAEWWTTAPLLTPQQQLAGEGKGRG
jgi:hypothetical protein